MDFVSHNSNSTWKSIQSEKLVIEQALAQALNEESQQVTSSNKSVEFTSYRLCTKFFINRI